MFLPGWAIWIIGLVVVVVAMFVRSLCVAASRDRRWKERWMELYRAEIACQEQRAILSRQSILESLELEEDDDADADDVPDTGAGE